MEAEDYGLGVNVGVKVVGGKFWFVCPLDVGAFRPMIHFLTFLLSCVLLTDWQILDEPFLRSPRPS